MSNKAGAGLMWYGPYGNIKEILLSIFEAGDAFYSEALAMITAIRWCQLGEHNTASTMHVLFTYSLMLVNEINGEEHRDPQSWRAAETICQIRETLQEIGSWLRIKHAGREYVGDAHTLANMARRQGINY
jgi:ribonuclease HI